MINSNHTPFLRPIQMSDFQTVFKWSQNEAFCEANDWELNRTHDELYSWWEKCVENKNSDFILIGIELYLKEIWPYLHTLIMNLL